MPQISITGNGGKSANNSGEGDGNSEEGGNFLGNYDSKRIASSYQKLQNQRRQEAQWINSNLDQVRRSYATQAKLENQNADLIRKHYRQEAEYENRSFDARRKQARQEAEYHNRSFDARQKQQQRADQSFFRTYQAATRENNIRDNRSAAASYHNMRYNAEQENRLYDQKSSFSRHGGGFRAAAAQLGRALEGRTGFAGRVGNAATSFGEASSIRGALESGALGAAGASALMAFDIAKDTVELPGKYSSKLNGLVAGARPFYDLQSSAARFGRGQGFDGQSLVDATYTHGAPPAWMAKYGLSPTGALDLARQAGQPIGSADQLQAVDTSVMAASRAQYIGGLDPSTLAGMAKTFTTLSGSGNNPNAEGNFSSRGTATGQVNDFYRRMAGAVQTGARLGLDASNVGGAIMSLMQVSAAKGATNVDAGSLSSYWSREASGGLAAMRDGSGVVDSVSALLSSANSAGYNGSALQNMAMQNFVNTHGGMAKSVSAVAKQLGLDPTSLSPVNKKLLSDAAAAGKNGDQLGYNNSIKQLMQPDQIAQMDTSWLKQSGLPVYAQTAAYASMTGQDTSAAANWLSGGGNAPPLTKGSGLGWSDVDDREKGLIVKYAKGAGVDPSIVASLINTESSFRPGATNGDHYGLGQISPGALADVQKNGMDKDVKLSDLYDADTNTRVTSDYLGLLKKRYGSDEQALEHYYGSKDPGKNATYASGILTGAVGYNGANSLQEQARVLAIAGQASTQAAQQDSNGASLLSSDTILAFSGGIVTATSDVSAFAQSVRDAMAALTRLAHTSGGPSGQPIWRGPHTKPPQMP
ncbi:transglycosylase SLT domain-containing protein [Acidisoma sp. L85]|uniref:transglycosylase SLT domain-containing protein n=1 Tax=Acidisoma sp. L85 TaxID=1641850 RepID=UPI00131A6F7D|nr:transglycosylase SLT domain-containing protein [Acidisoma sp. L85]